MAHICKFKCQVLHANILQEIYFEIVVQGQVTGAN